MPGLRFGVACGRLWWLWRAGGAIQGWRVWVSWVWSCRRAWESCLLVLDSLQTAVVLLLVWVRPENIV